MANDKSRKFKHNQIMFCILPWIVEFSRLFVFGEDRLRERGSLPATFYVLKWYFLWQTIRAANWNRIKYVFAYSLDFLSTIDPVSYTHLDVYKRQGVFASSVWLMGFNWTSISLVKFMSEVLVSITIFLSLIHILSPWVNLISSVKTHLPNLTSTQLSILELQNKLM